MPCDGIRISMLLITATACIALGRATLRHRVVLKPYTFEKEGGFPERTLRTQSF